MTELVVTIVGFAAFATNVLGNVLLARKHISGWLVRLVSIVLWGIYGSKITSWPMVANAVTFFCINLYGFWNWRRAAVEARAK